MTDFNYKKYSLEKLEEWVHDALSGEATPQEIYDTIKEVVVESRCYHKHHASRAYELMCLLNGNGSNVGITSLTGPDSTEPIVCSGDDSSPECKKSWIDFWEETYYPEKSNQYTDDELDAMCERAATEELKKECIEQNREYNLREAEYYNKRAQLDIETAKIKAAGGYEWTPLPVKDKVVKWQLPVEMDDPSGQYFVTFPDDLLEAANLKEGDQVEWVDQGDGSYLLQKV